MSPAQRLAGALTAKFTEMLFQEAEPWSHDVRFPVSPGAIRMILQLMRAWARRRFVAVVFHVGHKTGPISR
jgi:hypothetical protein